MLLFSSLNPGQVFKVVGVVGDKVQYWVRQDFQTAFRVWKDGGVWRKCRPIQRCLFVHDGPEGSNPEVQVYGDYDASQDVTVEAHA